MRKAAQKALEHLKQTGQYPSRISTATEQEPDWMEKTSLGNAPDATDAFDKASNSPATAQDQHAVEAQHKDPQPQPGMQPRPNLPGADGVDRATLDQQLQNSKDYHNEQHKQQSLDDQNGQPNQDYGNMGNDPDNERD